jgi:hypothetical protein
MLPVQHDVWLQHVASDLRHFVMLQRHSVREQGRRPGVYVTFKVEGYVCSVAAEVSCLMLVLSHILLAQLRPAAGFVLALLQDRLVCSTIYKWGQHWLACCAAQSLTAPHQSDKVFVSCT